MGVGVEVGLGVGLELRLGFGSANPNPDPNEVRQSPAHAPHAALLDACCAIAARWRLRFWGSKAQLPNPNPNPTLTLP